MTPNEQKQKTRKGCTYDLQVGNADVEVFGEVGDPNNAHVGHKDRALFALVRRQVPNAVDLVVDGLLGEHDELFVLDDGAWMATRSEPANP